MSTPEHVDVLVIGAGLSGIGAACRLKESFPGRSIAVLESREASGGTWDLFRYPGVRSDSDMFTFGYGWRPWRGDRALADGPSILDYLRTVAKEYAVDELIRYHHKVLAASWDSGTNRWTVQVDHAGEPTTFTTDFLWSCAGYYDYDAGYAPAWPGMERFRGRTVHPQFWPEDLEYAEKRVLVIGSGATAVTLVPSMADTAEHVTMLQRTPTYVLSRPGRDKVAANLGRLPVPLPATLSYRAARWANIALTIGSYQLARRRPATAKRLIREQAQRQLPDHIDVDVHFNPPYDPWDQRLCFVPDGDLFKALRRGQASVVTDTIDTFTESGVRVSSGKEIEADIVVTATGLRLLPLGGVTFEVDGERVELGTSMTYKGLMLTGMPNFFYTVGYTNASWTLKADLVSWYVVRLLRHLDRTGRRRVVPRRDPAVAERPFMDLMSGYIRRALDHFPKSGDRGAWQQPQNYLLDLRAIARGRIDDGNLLFG